MREKIEELFINIFSELENNRFENCFPLIDEILQIDDKNIEAYNLLFFIYINKKNFSDAVLIIKKLIELQPNEIRNLNNLAKLQFDLKNYNECISICIQILEINSKQIQPYIYLCFSFFSLNEFEKADFYIEKLLLIDKNCDVSIHILNSKIKYLLGNNNGAETILLNLYNSNNNNIEISHELVNFYLLSNQLDKSKKILDNIKMIEIGNVRTLFLLGQYEFKSKNYTKAYHHFIEAYGFEPKNVNTIYNIGNTLTQLRKYSDAISYFDRALAINSDFYDGWTNKGWALQHLSRFEEAIACYDKALSLNPNNALALSNKGVLLFDLDRYDEAEQCYLEAESIDKSYDTNTYNYSLLLLGKKQFSTGWEKYKYRWKWDGFTSSPLQTSKPEWLGDRSLKRLFLWGEQGIGDQILYASMLSDLRSFPQEKIVAVNKKLLPIFTRSFPNFSFISKDEFLPEEKYDEHFPLGDLGGFFRTDVTSFESAYFPYLVDDAAKTDAIRARLPNNRNLRCGISWKSSNRDVGDSKSMALGAWIPLLQKKDIDFINLQYGDTVDELEGLRANNIHVHEINGIDLFEDVDGALSIIQACDMIVTVSNTTAHLAGALGKKTYLLLSKGRGKFWYWHQSKNKNLWYPSIQIIEQDSPGDWDSVVKKLIIEIEK